MTTRNIILGLLLSVLGGVCASFAYKTLSFDALRESVVLWPNGALVLFGVLLFAAGFGQFFGNPKHKSGMVFSIILFVMGIAGALIVRPMM